MSGLRVLITRGSSDNIIPAEGTDRLIDMLEGLGAKVTVKTIATGHQITAEDIQVARSWLRETRNESKGAAA